MTDQPKPTGEWTVESVRELVAAFGTIGDVLPFGIIADAHNAALASEREKTKQAWREHDDVASALPELSDTIKQLGAANKQLRELLDAEREQREQAEKESKLFHQDKLRLIDELNAEREHHKQAEIAATELARQLDAAKDALAKVKL